MIFYKCSYDNPDNICLDYISSTFELNIYYESLAIDHENAETPVKKETINFVQMFHSDYLTMMEAYWDIYNYQEKKGIVQKIYDYIFENQFNFTFGHIKSSQVYSVEKLANLRPVDCDEKN